MKLIPLTQGQFAKVDDEDFDKFGHLKWQARWNKCTKSFYANRTERISGAKRYGQKMHRRVLGVTDPKIKVDHMNHDTLDNQRSNLRCTTQSQNCSNRHGADRDSVSGIRGVAWNEKTKSWKARIKFQQKDIYLGLYATSDLARAAYAAANRKYFGEFGGSL